MLRAIFDSMPDAALLVDESGTIRHANHSARELLAAGGDALDGGAFRTWMPEAGPRLARDRASMESAGWWELEQPVEVTPAVGGPVRLFTDVLPLKTARGLWTLVVTAPANGSRRPDSPQTFVMDREGVMSRAGACHAGRVRPDPDDAFAGFVHGAMRKAASDAIRREAVHHAYARFEHAGQARHYWARVFASRPGCEARQEAACQLIDVTFLKSALEVALEAEERFQRLLAAGQDAMFVVSGDMVLEANVLAAALLELAPEAIRGRTLAQLGVRLSDPDGVAVIAHRDASQQAMKLVSQVIDVGGRAARVLILRDRTVDVRLTEAQEIINEQEARLKSLEVELGRVLSRASPGQTPVASMLFGSRALRDASPGFFESAIEEYSRVLDLAVDKRYYESTANISHAMQELAARLGSARADPKDVIDIHGATLRKVLQAAPAARAQAYVEEGRLAVLELMGYVALFYRTNAWPAQRQSDRGTGTDQRDGA